MVFLAYLADASGGGALALGPVELLIILVVWLVPTFLIARWASRKGHSFAVFLLLGLLVSPIVSLIVAAVVSDRRTV